MCFIKNKEMHSNTSDSMNGRNASRHIHLALGCKRTQSRSNASRVAAEVRAIYTGLKLTGTRSLLVVK